MTSLISYPAIFSAAMVRAILREIEAPDTGKWQTRRLSETFVAAANPPAGQEGKVGYFKPTVWQKRYERWQAGERPWIWVRETFGTMVWHELFVGPRPPSYHTVYRAGPHPFNRDIPHGWTDGQDRWRPSIHMPKQASRICGPVTDMRREKLQDISEEDAIAEGSREPSLVPTIGSCWSERDAFAKLWESIHGPGAWEANPEVVVVQFIPQLANIGSIAHG